MAGEVEGEVALEMAVKQGVESSLKVSDFEAGLSGKLTDFFILE